MAQIPQALIVLGLIALAFTSVTSVLLSLAALASAAFLFWKQVERLGNDRRYQAEREERYFLSIRGQYDALLNRAMTGSVDASLGMSTMPPEPDAGQLAQKYLAVAAKRKAMPENPRIEVSGKPDYGDAS